MTGRKEVTHDFTSLTVFYMGDYTPSHYSEVLSDPAEHPCAQQPAYSHYAAKKRLCCSPPMPYIFRGSKDSLALTLSAKQLNYK